MKKELVYVALFLSLAIIAVSILTLLKVCYDSMTYSEPVKEPVYQFVCGTPDLTEDEKSGKETYENNCSLCHGKRHFKDNRLVNISQRIDTKFLIRFIQSEDKLIAEHDEVTSKINHDWGGNIYTHKFDLKADEIEAVLRYLDVNH